MMFRVITEELVEGEYKIEAVDEKEALETFLVENPKINEQAEQVSYSAYNVKMLDDDDGDVR